MQRRRLIGVAVGCGLAATGGVSSPPADGAAGLRVRDRLTWTHPDGSPVTFAPEVRVWCGPWASGVRVPSIHVEVGRRSRTGHPVCWQLDAVVADVRRRPVVRFPHSFVFDHPKGAQLFATDGHDEVNSDTDESSGRIRFERVGCGRRLRLAFRVDARLGSEFSDGEPFRVRGSFRASTSG